MGQRIVNVVGTLVIAIAIIQIFRSPLTPAILDSIGNLLGVGFSAELGRVARPRRAARRR